MKPVLELPKGMALPLGSTPASKTRTYDWLITTMGLSEAQAREVVQVPRKP